MTRKINVPALGQDVLDLIDAGGGGGGSGTIFVPVTYLLTGPNPVGVFSGTAPANYAFAGNALSASSQRFSVNYGTPRVEIAVFTVVWTSGSLSNRIELVSADDGPTNITQLVEVSPASAASPIVTDAIVTTQLDNLAQAGVFKQLLWRIKGGGSYTIYKVHVDVVWRYTI